MQALIEYPWPGNIRQLKNLVERLGIFSQDGTIDTDSFPPEMQETMESRSLPQIPSLTTVPSECFASVGIGILPRWNCWVLNATSSSFCVLDSLGLMPLRQLLVESLSVHGPLQFLISLLVDLFFPAIQRYRKEQHNRLPCAVVRYCNSPHYPTPTALHPGVSRVLLGAGTRF